ncbi:MAG: type II secretion system protein GspE, partial [Parasphingorhabdus sp.]
MMEIARGTEAVVSEADDGPVEAAAVEDLPYTYARDHGLLLCAMAGGRASVVMRAGSDPSALLEVRRYLSLPFDVDLV